MWSLHNEKTNDVFYMLCNSSYRMGKDYNMVNNRKTETLIGPNVKKDGAVDTSISRNHALFKLTHKMKNLDNPEELPKITLTDTGSTYGTFMNSSIEKKVDMQKKHPFLLRDSFVISFGMQWNLWKLRYRPLVVLLPSPQEEPRAQEVKDNVLRLGGHVVHSWSSEVTHLTVAAIKLTVKLVSSVAKGLPIITPDFWRAWVRAIEDQQGTNMAPEPVVLPAASDFLPPVRECTLSQNEVSFAPNPQRSQLFKGKTFVFPSNKQMHRMAEPVKAAGGKPTLWCHELTLHQMCQDNVIVVNNFNNDDSQLPDKFQNLQDMLASKNKRLIPESEIALAIIFNSVETNCNPYFMPASLMRARKEERSQSQTPAVVLAPDTCDVELQPPSRGRQEVLETVEQEQDDPFAGPSRPTRSRRVAAKSASVDKVTDEDEKAGPSGQGARQKVPEREKRRPFAGTSRSMENAMVSTDDSDGEAACTSSGSKQKVPKTQPIEDKELFETSGMSNSARGASKKSRVLAEDSDDDDKKPVPRGKGNKQTVPESVEMEEEDLFETTGAKGTNVKDSIGSSCANTGTDSILTFRVNGAGYTVPKSLSLKTPRGEDSEEMHPPRKNPRMSTEQEDSQEVVVCRRLRAAILEDDSLPQPQAAGVEDEDVFGFEESDITSLISKPHSSQSSSYTIPIKSQASSATVTSKTQASNKLTSQASASNSVPKASQKRLYSEDKEKEDFSFKKIKLPKLATTENDFDFGDDSEMPAVSVSKKSAPDPHVAKLSGRPKVNQPGPSAPCSSRSTVLSQDNGEWMERCDPLPIKHEDDEEESVDPAVLFVNNLIKPRQRKDAGPRHTNNPLAKNVKPFRKSWHPHNQQLPNMIAGTDMKRVSCEGEEGGPDPREEAERLERQRHRDLMWNFPEKRLHQSKQGRRL